MRRVVIDMQSYMFSDTLASALRRFDPDYEVYTAESPDKTSDLAIRSKAHILVMEVTEYTSWKLEERMKIRAEVKTRLPSIKIILIVDENTNKALAGKVRQAKKDGLIDQFLFGSVSEAYLVAAIDAV